MRIGAIILLGFVELICGTSLVTRKEKSRGEGGGGRGERRERRHTYSWIVAMSEGIAVLPSEVMLRMGQSQLYRSDMVGLGLSARERGGERGEVVESVFTH